MTLFLESFFYFCSLLYFSFCSFRCTQGLKVHFHVNVTRHSQDCSQYNCNNPNVVILYPSSFYFSERMKKFSFFLHFPVLFHGCLVLLFLFQSKNWKKKKIVNQKLKKSALFYYDALNCCVYCPLVGNTSHRTSCVLLPIHF